MKTSFKAILTCVILLSIIIIQTSCNGFYGTDITDQKGINDNILPKIEEMVGKDSKVIEIEFETDNSDGFSKTLSCALVHYFEPGSGKVVCKLINLRSSFEVKDWHVSSEYSKDDIKPDDFKKYSEIDFSKISENVNKGAKMLEDLKGTFSGLGSYYIKAYTDPAKATQIFTLQSSAGSTTSRKGGKLVTENTYLEFKCSVDADGNVTPIDE